MTNTLTAKTPEQLANQFLAAQGAMTDFEQLNGHRAKVREKIGTMLLIEELIAAGERQGRAVAKLARPGKRGFSAKKLAEDFRIWKHGGLKQNAHGQRVGKRYPARDWRMFIDNYHNGDGPSARSSEGLVKLLCAIQSTGSRTDTYDATAEEIHRRWFAGDDIPDFRNIRVWCAERGLEVPSGNIIVARPGVNMPKGLSKDNLCKILREALGPRNGAVFQIIKQGEHAAHDHWGDQVLRTRANLPPMKFITADDIHFPLEVIFMAPGEPHQIVRPQGMFLMDVATGYVLAYGVQGAFRRSGDTASSLYEQGKKEGTRKGMTPDELRFLLQQMHERWGYPTEYPIYGLFEKATAKVDDLDARVLIENFNYARIDDTGLVKRKLLKSGYVESGGCPWRKGWIEAFFRLLQTRLDHLPLSLGTTHQTTRADRGVTLFRDGKLRADRSGTAVAEILQTLRNCESRGIPVEQLKHRPLTMAEFHEVLDRIVHALNWRTQHNLEGFEPVAEYLIHGQRIRVTDPRVTDLIQMGYELELQPPRMEAPAERFARLMQGQRFAMPTPSQLAPIGMFKDLRKVNRKGQITIERGGEKMQFRDAASAAFLQRNIGKEFVCFLSTDRQQVHICDPDDMNHVICSATRCDTRVDLNDSLDNPAIELRRVGEVDRARNDSVRSVAAGLLSARETEMAEARAHDDAILGRATLGEQMERAREHALSRAPRPKENEARRSRIAALAALKQEPEN